MTTSIATDPRLRRIFACLRPLVASVALVLLGFPLAAEATIRYVATTGNDRGAGTIVAPWQTLKYALSHVACGDTVLVRAGVYGGIDTQAVPATSCTSFANAVTLKAYPGEAVHLPTMKIYAEHYLIFEDLILDGQRSGMPGATVTIGPGGGGSASHIRLVNLDIHGHRQVPCAPFTGSCATTTIVGLGGGYNEILGGSIHDGYGVQYPDAGANNGMHGIYPGSAYNLVDGVELYNIDGYAIHNYSSPGGVNHHNIYRNLYIHDCGKPVDSRGQVVFTAAIGIINGDDNQVYNNIISRCTYGIQSGRSNRTVIANNTIYGLTGVNAAPIWVTSGTGVVVRNNIVYGNVVDTIDTAGATSPMVSNNLMTDPSFINVAANAFGLQGNSRAIDAGMTVPFISTDISGTARPQGGGMDIGAYEYPTTGPAPAADGRVLRPTITREPAPPPP